MIKEKIITLKLYHIHFLDGNVPNNLSYGIFISQLVRLARVNSTLKSCVTELLGKLVAQGFKLAALCKKFVKFYKSRFGVNMVVIFMMNLLKCFNHLILFCNLY